MSSLSCSSVCIKYLLFIFNLLFVITGIIIICAGASTKTFYHEYEVFLNDQYFSASNFLIAIGAIIFIVAFFGCCGAVKENFCMTLTFSTLLILIFVLELAAGICGYVLRNETEIFLEQKLNESLYKYNHDDDVTKMWDEVQRDLKCCGVFAPIDWKVINDTGEVPMSCCAPQIGAIGEAKCNNQNCYQPGCMKVFGDLVTSNAMLIGGVGIGLAVVQFLGIFFSCHLSRQIKKNYETV